ncbi:12938_t:CDS:2, partial [Gigaspora rosea]
VYSERRKFSSCLQLKAMKFFNAGFYKKNTSITTKIIELEKEISSLKKNKINLITHIQLLSIQVVHAKNTKRRYISKIHAVFKMQNNNMGVTSIQATVNCTKAVYEFLTEHTPTHWKNFIKPVYQFLTGLNNIECLPARNHTHEISDMILTWIEEFQNYIENISDLFGDELLDVEDILSLDTNKLKRIFASWN